MPLNDRVSDETDVGPRVRARCRLVLDARHLDGRDDAAYFEARSRWRVPLGADVIVEIRGFLSAAALGYDLGRSLADARTIEIQANGDDIDRFARQVQEAAHQRWNAA